MEHPWAISALNRVYSFIHIPATIAFLAHFYHTQPFGIYAPVRRTMALVANLLTHALALHAPASPPCRIRLRRHVHKHGAGSVWAMNKFCNPLAAMPSLHFSYLLIIGITPCTHLLQPHGAHQNRTRRHMYHMQSYTVQVIKGAIRPCICTINALGRADGWDDVL